MRSNLLLFAGICAVVTATSSIPFGYERLGKSNPSGLIQLIVAIKHQNAALLEETLYAVSDPTSSRYGRHLSRDAVVKMIQPSEEAVGKVVAWLEDNDIHGELSVGRDYLTAMTTIATAEKLLSTKYYSFRSRTSKSNFTVNRCSSYSVPDSVQPFVDFVAPTIHFPRVHSVKLSPTAASGVTPDLIRQMYSIGNAKGNSTENKQQAAGFLEEYASATDLASFITQFYPPIKGEEVNFVGPDEPGTPGLEASLDVQYIMSIGAGINTTYWYTPGTRPYDNEPYLVWLTNLTALSDAELPKVISVSYGDDEPVIEYSYGSRVNEDFQALGSRGVSIMFSSGDGGVGGITGNCKNGFIPTFPAASPYVTAVGATTQPSNEVAASFSGGGFSNFWPQPSYQTAAVNQYFKVAKNLPPADMYNKSGAGFPDVGAIGTNFNIVCGGGVMQVEGTSCSSPTFTGMISLLNDHRLNAGKTTLGWLNPLLYQHPEIFHQITSGNNPGCGYNGFYCAPGWNPVTGLGTLNYTAALNLVMGLP